MKLKHAIGLLTIVLTGLLLFSCDDEKDGYRGEVVVKSIAFPQGEQQVIPFNEEFILQCEVGVYPANGRIPELEWSSNNAAVEVVSVSGGACKLLGKEEGVEALLTVSDKGGEVVANCKVVVEKIYIRLFSTQGYLMVKPSEELDMHYKVLDPSVNVTEVSWSSANTAVATVDEKTGVVTAVAAGETEIVLKAQTSLGEMTVKETVKVSNEIPLTGVYLRVIPGASETTWTADNADTCTTISAKLSGNKYVYVEVMYLPANTTYQLPQDGSVKPWGGDAQGKFNTNSGVNGTGRTDQKVVRILPKAAGTGKVTATIDSYSATADVTIY